jgi:hypothetical protein
MVRQYPLSGHGGAGMTNSLNSFKWAAPSKTDAAGGCYSLPSAFSASYSVAASRMVLIASGRLGRGSARAAIHASSAASWEGCNRTVIGAPLPVAGRPRDFMTSRFDMLDL